MCIRDRNLGDDCTFEVRFANLKDIASVKAGSVISVEYTSTLNNQAVIGSAGNKNTSHVTYTLSLIHIWKALCP